MSTTDQHDMFPLQFLNIPIATGDAARHPGTGEHATVRAITVRLIFADGVHQDLPIHRVGTGWWAQHPTVTPDSVTMQDGRTRR